MNRKFPVWLAAATVLTALVSLLSLSYRYRVEARNGAVGIAMESDSVAENSLAAGQPIETTLSALKTAGLSALVVQESTIDQEVKAGRIVASSTADGRTVLAGSQSHLARVRLGLDRRFGTSLVVEVGLTGLVFSASYEAVAKTGIGLDPLVCASAKAAGLEIVARHANVPGLGPRAIRLQLEESKRLGAVALLPMGEEVPGFRKLTEDIAVALQETGINYLSPEFVKIAGDMNVRKYDPSNTLKLHSIQSAEMSKMSSAAIVERYAKAAKERNVRWLLVRPIQAASEQPGTDLAETVRLVRTGIEAEGLVARSPKPFDPPNVPTYLFALIGVACVPVFASALALALGRSSPAVWMWVAGALVGGLAVVDSGREYAALAAALAFPVVAFGHFLRGKNWLTGYLAITAVSLVGGLAVAGLLNTAETMAQIDSFSGVKLAHFLPIVIVGVMAVREVAKPSEIMESPAKWGQLVFGMLGAGALAFMLSRTGNDNPAAVSGLELQLRALLENVMAVRPRTKEFLFGHPALVIALALAANGALFEKNKALWAVASALGAIGATSVVNTMCHLHTPLEVSLQRICVGWLIGGILGGILWPLIRRLLETRAKSD